MSFREIARSLPALLALLGCGPCEQSEPVRGQPNVRHVVDVAGAFDEPGPGHQVETPEARLRVTETDRVGSPAGSLVVGTADEWSAAVRSLEPRVRCGNAEAGWTDVRTEPSEDGSLEAEGRVVVGGATLTLRETYTLDRATGAVDVRSRIEGAGCEDPVVGRRLRLYAGATAWLAPGGDIERDARDGDLFVSARGASAVGLRFGGPIAEARRRQPDPHVGAFVDLFPARSSGRMRVVAATSSAEAVRRVETDVEVATIHLDDGPATSELTITTPDGEPWLRTRLPSGTTRVALPPGGRGTAQLRAFGQPSGDPIALRPGADVDVPTPPVGTVRVRVTESSRGDPVTARLTVRGRLGTPDPVLGGHYDARGAVDSLLAVHGSASFALPPGSYVVRASRGPRFEPQSREVLVVADATEELRVELRELFAADPYVCCDLHLHSAPSPDSRVTLEDRVASLAAEGVECGVPTDHNAVTAYAAAARSIGLPLITAPGVEVTTHDPNWGHFNAYPIEPDADAPAGGPPPPDLATPELLFAAIRERAPAATIQVNHPRLEPNIGYFDLVGYDPVTGEAIGPYSDDYDLVEVWNGFDLARLDRVERNLTEWMAILARRRLVAVGNSDSHSVQREWAGYPRTCVRVVDVANARFEDVLEALQAGRAFVTNGPYLELRVDEAGPGDTVPFAARVRVDVRVRSARFAAPETIELLLGGESVATIELPPAEEPLLDHRVRAVVRPPAEGGPLIAVARGTLSMTEHFGRQGTQPLAFTNPIWLAPRGGR